MMHYKAKKLARPLQIDANWDKPEWQDVRPALIRNYIRSKPCHFPRTEVKVAYDDAAVYAVFRVEDRYVRAVATQHQDSVCRDSCVEFFFTPDTDVSKGYFNLEMNCGGTMLFHFQRALGEDNTVIPKSECDMIRIAHSMPVIIEPEIKEPVTWTVEYSIPIALLERYCRVTRPSAHVAWRANFYKCADKTSHPHWLTWSPVTWPDPHFHLPRFFGVLEFE